MTMRWSGGTTGPPAAGVISVPIATAPTITTARSTGSSWISEEGCIGGQRLSRGQKFGESGINALTELDELHKIMSVWKWRLARG